jgi:hypothetical protein
MEVGLRKWKSMERSVCMQARQVLEKDFPQLRHVTVSNLMLVKEDIMLPLASTFYSLVVGKVCKSSY